MADAAPAPGERMAYYLHLAGVNFIWPEALWLLLLLPVLVVLYWWLLKRRRRSALPYSNLGLIREALGRGSWLRHLPSALLLAAFGFLIVAVARPTWAFRLPTQQQTIVLAMNVSLSMRAKDVAPDRISASREAARAFVQALPSNVRIGVVSYAGVAQVVQPPTTNKENVLEAIKRVQLQRGTGLALSRSERTKRRDLCVGHAARAPGRMRFAR